LTYYGSNNAEHVQLQFTVDSNVHEVRVSIPKEFTNLGIVSTTPIPLPSRGWVGSLPDGTHDALSIDGAGKVTWELGVGDATKDDTTFAALWDSKAGKTLAITANGVTKTKGKSMSEKLQSGDTWNVPYTIETDSSGRVRVSFPSTEDFANAVPLHYIYPLATPTTEDMGYVDLPDIPEGAVVSMPELEGLGVESWTSDAVARYVRAWAARS
jgi:hypothetical protein